MYKLVVVGGSKRGTEIVLNEGANILGRGHDADHVLDVEGVSKKHMQLTVNGESVFLEDLNSSNGTFVNGKLVKKRTLEDRDKIALPNLILQLVFVKEKKKIVKRKVLKADEEDVDFARSEVAPNNLLGKIRFFFKHKVMNVIYSFNEQYEWNVLLGILIFLFICGNIYVSVGPVLNLTESIVFSEIKSRGKQYADEVVRINSIHLSRGDLQRIDTLFLDKRQSDGVESYELFDMEGRIVRPAAKIDTNTRDIFSVNALNHYKKSGEYTNTFVDRSLGNGVVGIAKTLMVNNLKTGQNEPVGIIALRFKPDSMMRYTVMNSTAYMKALIYTGMLAVIFYGIIYYMTLKPIDEVRFQAEEVMRGRRKEIEPKRLFSELAPLSRTFNGVLMKNRELMNEDVGDFAEMEEDGPYVNILREIMLGTDGAVLILNSEKNVEYVNDTCSDLTGMRENLVQGQSILDSASNEGFAGTLIKLCDNSANNSGTTQEDFCELGGQNYVVHAMCLIGKDQFPKAYYISFYKDV